MPEPASVRQKHIHTYGRIKKRPDYYQCMDSTCHHYIHKMYLIGKASLCTACGKEFNLTGDDLRRSRPKCLDCANTKQAKEHRNRLSIVRNVLNRMSPATRPENEPEEFE